VVVELNSQLAGLDAPCDNATLSVREKSTAKSEASEALASVELGEHPDARLLDVVDAALAHWHATRGTQREV
jgi:hypothetical protein